MTPTFQGEVQMRRWSDSSTQGVQITFALPGSDELEPLKGKEGKRFMAVLVEIGDDEQPVQQPRKDTRGPLCKEAQDLCKMPEFRAWLLSVHGLACETDLGARNAMLAVTGGDSRADYDSDGVLGDRFIKHIRVPFMKRRQAA